MVILVVLKAATTVVSESPARSYDSLLDSSIPSSPDKPVQVTSNLLTSKKKHQDLQVQDIGTVVMMARTAVK